MQNIIETKSDYFRTKRSRIFWITLLLTLLTLTVIGFTFINNNMVPDAQLTVSVAEQPAQARGNGKVFAPERYVLSSTESGFIEQVFVSQGYRVQVGEPLIKIANPELFREFKEVQFEADDIFASVAYEQSQLALQLDAIASDLAKARSELKGQRLEVDANQKLREYGIISAVKFEQLKLKVERAEMDVSNLLQRYNAYKKGYASQNAALQAKRKAAEEKVAYFKSRIDALTITSPIDGVVKELELAQGEAISVGNRVLEIVNDKALAADIAIPQYLGFKIDLNAVATIKSPNGEVEGTVDFVDPIVRDGAVMVRIKLPQDLPSWMSMGQSIEAAITTSSITHIAFVNKPKEYSHSEQWRVYRLVNGERVSTDITIISADQDNLFLTPGLNHGEQIVLVPNTTSSTFFD